MNLETDQQFTSLKAIMALKKHEQPPPGFFNRLPGNIISQIQKENSARKTWVEKLQDFLVRPAIALSFGMAAFGGVIAGVLYGFQNAGSPQASIPLANGSFASSFPRSAMPQSGLSAFSVLAVGGSNSMFSSESPSGLFNNSRVQPVKFNYVGE
ncbi:MAG: hypothetical protein JWN25_3283 [Verrucomicrobiales bacterium]|nr:hypothetical protein [Verrucomicrobiales bacterium]